LGRGRLRLRKKECAKLTFTAAILSTGRNSKKEVLFMSVRAVFASVFVAGAAALGAFLLIHTQDAATGGKRGPMVKERKVLTAGKSRWLCVTFSQDGKYLAAGQQNGGVSVWDTATMNEYFRAPGRDVKPYDFSATVLAIGFSRDNRFLAWTLESEKVIVLDIRRKKTCSLLTGNRGILEFIAFSRDGQDLITADDEGIVRLWHLSTQQAHVAFEQSKSRYKRERCYIHSAALSPEGNVLAIGLYENVVLLDAAATMKEKGASPACKCVPMGLCFRPDGKVVAGITNNGVQFWDGTSAKVISRLPINTNGASMSSLAFSPDGKFIAIALSKDVGHGSRVEIWDCEGLKEVFRYTCSKSEGISQLDWSPNGDILATAGTDGNLAIWDLSIIVKRSMLK
jgi:WD40 repeat protein